MHTIINICVLFLWLQTLTFVKSQDCTLEQFLNGNLYDSNFDTTGLQASYPGGKQVRVSCSVGYSGFFKLICVEGRWQSRGSRCQPVGCELKLPPLEGTQYEPALRSAFSPGDKVKVICGENYWILNHQTTSTEILCQDDGSWNHTPVCQEIVCSNDRDPLLDYWDVSYWSQNKVGDTAFYGCKSGYKSTDGSDQATCTRDGWTPKPLCQAPSHCGRPPTLEDGDTVGTTREQYNLYDKVKYSCQSYYTMEGGPYKTCINGQWTGDIRCLKACTVDREAMTRRNITFRFSRDNKIYSTHNDEIEFVCTRGSPVGGVGMRQRCLDGVIELPTCQ